MNIFRKHLSSWVAFGLSLGLCISPFFAQEGGKVELRLSEAVVSNLLTEALRGLDPSIRAQVHFKNGDKAGSPGKAVLVYHVFFAVTDLRFDSLEGVSSRIDYAPLKKALEDLRVSLSSRGISEVSFEVGTMMNLVGSGDQISATIKLYPRTLRVHTKNNDGFKMDILLNEILRPLILDRYLEQILAGVERKYLRDLQIGQIFKLEATNLAKDHLISVQIDLGEVNRLNKLEFIDFLTTNRSLLLRGRTRVPKGSGL